MSSKLPRQASLCSSVTEPDKRIRILTDYGSQVEVDKSLSLKLYFRSGREMLRMANMYCDDGQLESAFILYSKFITLFVEKVPSHPNYKQAVHEEVADFKRKVRKVFPIAEELKSKLKKRYAEEEKIYLEEQKRLAEERAAEEERRRKALEEQERQDEELAKKLQEEEEAGVKHEQDERYWKLRTQEEDRLKEEEKRKNEGHTSGVPPEDSSNVAPASGMTDAALAAAGAGIGVAASTSVPPSDGSMPAIPPAADGTSLPPPPSYSQYLNEIGANPPEVPDRRLKKNLVISDQNDTPLIPSVDRSKKPAIDHHMSLGEFGGLASGKLRTVVVPSQVMSRFLSAAEGNTAREAETMGILCGKLSQGVFRITCLFIPQQKGGHDSCDMENEEDLIYYQDNHNLITLGWIHTHPTQTAFLSSVDLHSHFPWQKMMPEAIAIVCSPKFQETGIFKLTDHGLDVIGACKEKGFHPHNKEPPLFEICEHVQLSETDNVVVEDKRR